MMPPLTGIRLHEGLGLIVIVPTVTHLALLALVAHLALHFKWTWKMSKRHWKTGSLVTLTTLLLVAGMGAL